MPNAAAGGSELVGHGQSLSSSGVLSGMSRIAVGFMCHSGTAPKNILHCKNIIRTKWKMQPYRLVYLRRINAQPWACRFEMVHDSGAKRALKYYFTKMSWGVLTRIEVGRSALLVAALTHLVSPSLPQTLSDSGHPGKRGSSTASGILRSLTL